MKSSHLNHGNINPMTLLLQFLLRTAFSSFVPAQGFITAEPTSLSSIAIHLNPLLTTSTSRYFLSSESTDVQKAKQICRHHGGYLLSIQSSEEFQNLQESLNLLHQKPPFSFWTSGVRYSNATIENLLIWSSTQEPFPFFISNDHDHLKDLRLAGYALQKRYPVRNRRAAAVKVDIFGDGDDGDDCPCPCPNSTIPYPSPCKTPICEGYRPRCIEKEPRHCILARPPLCSAQEKNCSVDCGQPKDCQVIKQPVCTIIENPSKERCRLETPNLGRCHTKPQNCTIVAPGHCHSRREDCKPGGDPAPPCIPTIKPCKKPCTMDECTTVTPPCHSHQAPCVTPTCPPPSNTTTTSSSSSGECISRCKRSTNDKSSRWRCEQGCISSTTTTEEPPTDCGDPVCPPPVTICPPPVSSCTRPFVDCSPIVCQSNVLICPAPKIRCPPPTVTCDAPQVRCDDPEVECPEPEVICEEPEINCTKPVVKCPDPVVHCNPVITTCEPASFLCGDPVLDCPDPVVNCEEPTECPIDPPPPDNGGGSGGNCPCDQSKQCGRGRGASNKSKRGIPPLELEFVEKIECIALQTRNKRTEWFAESCDLNHQFICKRDK